MPTPEAIARDVERATSTPEALTDLDQDTQRRIRRAAERADVSAESLWAASRAASIAALAAHDDADRVASAARS